MFNRLIKTEEDYEKVLTHIEGLMDAKPGTAGMDELELLTALVKMYEDQHYPINQPGPVEAIKFRMEQLGLSQKDMVPYMGTKSRVSEILNKKRPLTLTMMRSLNKELGISAEVLLKVPGADFPEGMRDLEWCRFPVVEMAKRCWLPKIDGIKENAEELMRGFIEKAGGMETASYAFFRQGQTPRFNSKMDRYALTAWCFRVLSIARETPLKTKYNGSIQTSILQNIARLSYFDNGPLLAKEYLAKQGIHLIVVHSLPKTYLDGAAMLMTDGTPVIGMTLRHDRIDNFWFCLLHEMAHIAKHLSASKRIIIDDLDLRGHDDGTNGNNEIEADEMARDSLIPKKYWGKKQISGRVSAAEVSLLSEKINIHPAIIAGRIRFEQKNYQLLTKYIGNNQVRKLFPENCITTNALNMLIEPLN